MDVVIDANKHKTRQPVIKLAVWFWSEPGMVQFYIGLAGLTRISRPGSHRKISTVG